MKYLLWCIEAINWLIWGMAVKMAFKVTKRKEYDDISEREGWGSCYNVQGALNRGTELWLSRVGFKPFFPEFLRKEYILCFRYYQ